MAFNFKTAIPDTSIDTNAFMFGADSQSSASPSIYSMTTVKTFLWNAPTLVNPNIGVATGTSLAINGATIGTNALAVTGTSTMGSVTYFPDGSASSPSIAHSGDTNCGIYFPASDTISITTSGSDRFKVDSSGRIGLPGTPTTFSYMLINPTITGQTFEDTISISSLLGSDVTGAGRGIQSRVTTGAAAAYSNIIHFYVNPFALFAGSSLTNQYAFYAESSITTATNNYGFYSNIASSSGRWNFYANGTAANYFAGDVRIGSNTAGASKLVVNDSSIQLNTAKTPASASDTGTTGQICWDSGYVYVCVATNTWKRAAIATW